MPVYLIYCDLDNSKDRCYDELFQKVNDIGEVHIGITHPNRSWLLDTPYSELEIWNILKEYIKPKDKMLISRLSQTWKGRLNISTEQWIKKHLHSS